jgi:DNA-binding transcriptional ArsR family regulator
MRGDRVEPAPQRRGGRRKGSGKRADASAPWPLRAIQALADGSRWSIVQYLSEHEGTVGGIARSLGLSVACTSKHLSILREAGLVEVRRQGREARCRLAASGSDGDALFRVLGLVDGVGRPASREAAVVEGTGGTWRPASDLASAAPELQDSTVPSKRRYQSNDLDDYLL